MINSNVYHTAGVWWYWSKNSCVEECYSMISIWLWYCAPRKYLRFLLEGKMTERMFFYSVLVPFYLPFYLCHATNDRVRFVWIAFEMSKHQYNLFSGSIDSTSNCGLPSCGPIWMVCCLMSNKLTERLGQTLSYQIMIDIVCYRLMVDEIFPYSIRQCSCGSCLVHGPS